MCAHAQSFQEVPCLIQEWLRHRGVRGARFHRQATATSQKCHSQSSFDWLSYKLRLGCAERDSWVADNLPNSTPPCVLENPDNGAESPLQNALPFAPSVSDCGP